MPFECLDRKPFFYIEDGGQRTSYKEDAWNVTPGVLEVFRFDMLEGNERSLDEPNSVVLPESMARKIFGDESAVGKQLISANPMEDAKIVKGVYKDFPRNSALKNVMYTSMSPKENYDNWGNWNYFSLSVWARGWIRLRCWTISSVILMRRKPSAMSSNGGRRIAWISA